MMSVLKKLLAILVIILVAGTIVWYLYFYKPTMLPESVEDIYSAAKKADALQSAELQSSIRALERNDASEIIWGDRFLRWTVLAYTLWMKLKSPKAAAILIGSLL